MPASLTDLGRSAGKAQKARSRARPSEPEKIQFISAILSWHGWQTSRCSSKSRCADDGSVPIAYCSMAFLRRCIREIVHPTQKYSQINFGQNHLGERRYERLVSSQFRRIHCTGRTTLTPSPHSVQIKASITEKPGKVFSAPQCVQLALQSCACAPAP